jgi:hypothetical protein
MLSKLLKDKTVDTRGKGRKGICDNYSTFGLHADRIHTGLHRKKISEEMSEEEAHLQQMCSHMTDKARAYTPFGLYHLFKMAKKLCGSVFNYNEMNPDNDMFNSMAVSRNYISPAHVDDDACISGLMVIHSMHKKEVKKDFYYMNQDIALYFLFPSHGIAVALRPGDYFLFNPIYTHHVSQRTLEYKDKDVYLASFYVKNKEVTGNDNSKQMPESFMKVAEHLDKVNGTNNCKAMKKAIYKQNKL